MKDCLEVSKTESEERRKTKKKEEVPEYLLRRKISLDRTGGIEYIGVSGIA